DDGSPHQVGMSNSQTIRGQRRATAKRLQGLATLAASECSRSDAGEMAICLAVARLLEPGLSATAWDWIARQLGGVATSTVSSAELRDAAAAVLAKPCGELDPLAEFYEQFLAIYHPAG